MDLEESGLYGQFSQILTPDRESRSPPRTEQVRTHLFPSFGRGRGFGEPDAAIANRDFVALFEVKTEGFRRATVPVGMADREFQFY
jgi:hypothetical protein